MSVSEDTTAPGAGPGCGDKRRLRKTKTPGVFKRVDGKGKAIGYVCVFRAAGRQRKRHARTYAEARKLKRESEADHDRGELQERTAITFRRYLDEWVERYRGQGRRGFRENTRDEYRRLLAAYAHPYFPARLKLVDVSPYVLARFVDWLADDESQGKRLSDRTIDRQCHDPAARRAGDRPARGSDPPQPGAAPLATAPRTAGRRRDQSLHP